jgi:Kae1-associated kinase Bud32
MRWAVSRFIMAAKKYIDSNLLEIIDERLKIKSAIKGIEIDNYVLWLRGIKAYLTHGRSAKVSPKIVGEELKSKIIRSMDTLRSPREIEDPDILLELENSYFTPERQGINDMVKALFGTYSRIRGMVKRGLLSPLCIIKVDREDFSKAIVIKAFNILWVFKWVFVQLWLIDVKRFTLHPRKRLVNEYLGLTWLKNKLSVNVPTPLLLDWGGGRLVMEYIDGDRLSDYLDDHDAMELEEYFYEYGRILARIHREGYTLGDTKIQNILVRDDELYLIDVEQWSTKKDFAWDISLFIFYTLKFRLRERGILDLISKFVEGYLEEGGEKMQMEKAVGVRYIRPFVPLVAPHLIYKVRKLVLQHS